MNLDLLVPDIGDFENVEIIEVLVKKGDKINKNDPVVTLESDKSSVEVPSEYEGTIENINVKIGDKVSKGDLILTLSSENKAEHEKISKTLDEKIPPSTEKLIEEAETATKSDTKVETKVIEPTQIKQTRLINEVKMVSSNDDIDPVETKEWLDSLSAVLQNDGSERAHFLIKQLIDRWVITHQNRCEKQTAVRSHDRSIKRSKHRTAQRPSDRAFEKISAWANGRARK